MGYIDITGRYHPAGTYYEGVGQPGDPVASPPPAPGYIWDTPTSTWVAPIPPPPQPDPRAFRMAIPLDASVAASDQSALMADPRANQFLWAIQDQNWAFAQVVYGSIKGAPGTGFTTADVESLGAMFATYNLPLTP